MLQAVIDFEAQLVASAQSSSIICFVFYAKGSCNEVFRSLICNVINSFRTNTVNCEKHAAVDYIIVVQLLNLFGWSVAM